MFETGPKKENSEEYHGHGGKEKTALALAAFLSIAGAEKGVQAAEIDPSMSYEQGIEILHKSALEDDVEKGLYFITNNNGVRWSATKTSAPSASSETVIKYEPDQMSELVTDGVEEIKNIHTHPATLIEQVFGMNSKPDQMTADQYTQPPSPSDMIFTFRADALYRKHDIEYQTEVVDPMGVWNIKIDAEHAMPKLVVQFFSLYDNLSSHLINSGIATKDNIKDVINTLAHSMTLAELQDLYGKEISNTIGNYIGLNRQLERYRPLFTYTAKAQKFFENYSENPTEAVVDVIEYASRDGIELTFTPFEQQEPLKASVTP